MDKLARLGDGGAMADVLAAGGLDELEDIVYRGFGSFVAVGLALAAIRDRELYLHTHDTWRAYCEDRWGFKDSRARQLIAAAEAVDSGEIEAKTEWEARQKMSERRYDRNAPAPKTVDAHVVSVTIERVSDDVSPAPTGTPHDEAPASPAVAVAEEPAAPVAVARPAELSFDSSGGGAGDGGEDDTWAVVDPALCDPGSCGEVASLNSQIDALKTALTETETERDELARQVDEGGTCDPDGCQIVADLRAELEAARAAVPEPVPETPIIPAAEWLARSLPHNLQLATAEEKLDWLAVQTQKNAATYAAIQRRLHEQIASLSKATQRRGVLR